MNSCKCSMKKRGFFLTWSQKDSCLDKYRVQIIEYWNLYFSSQHFMSHIMSLSNWGINFLLKWRMLLIHVSTLFSPPDSVNSELLCAAADLRL